jgi:hypothetical protein
MPGVCGGRRRSTSSFFLQVKSNSKKDESRQVRYVQEWDFQWPVPAIEIDIMLDAAVGRDFLCNSSCPI